MLLRLQEATPTTSCPIDLSKEQKKHLDALAKELNAPGADNAALTLPIHNLAFSLLRAANGRGNDGHGDGAEADPHGLGGADSWMHPLQRFLAIEHLQPDGRFSEAQNVSHNLSSWTFVIRAVIFYQIFITQSDRQDGLTRSVAF